MEDTELESFLEEYENELLSPENDYSEILVLDLEEDFTEYRHNVEDVRVPQTCGSRGIDEHYYENGDHLEKGRTYYHLKCVEGHSPPSDGRPQTELSEHSDNGIQTNYDVAKRHSLSEPHCLDGLTVPNADDTVVNGIAEDSDDDEPADKKRRTTSKSELPLMEHGLTSMGAPQHSEGSESRRVNELIVPPTADIVEVVDDDEPDEKNRGMDSRPEQDGCPLSSDLSPPNDDSSSVIVYDSSTSVSHSPTSPSISVVDLTGDVSDVMRKKDVSLLLHRTIMSKFDETSESTRPRREVNPNVPNIIVEFDEFKGFPKSADASQIKHSVIPSSAKRQRHNGDPNQELNYVKIDASTKSMIKEASEVVEISDDSDNETLESSAAHAQTVVGVGRGRPASGGSAMKEDLIRQYAYGYLMGLKYKALQNCQDKLVNELATKHKENSSVPVCVKDPKFVPTCDQEQTSVPTYVHERIGMPTCDQQQPTTPAEHEVQWVKTDTTAVEQKFV